MCHSEPPNSSNGTSKRSKGVKVRQQSTLATRICPRSTKPNSPLISVSRRLSFLPINGHYVVGLVSGLIGGLFQWLILCLLRRLDHVRFAMYQGTLLGVLVQVRPINVAGPGHGHRLNL